VHTVKPIIQALHLNAQYSPGAPVVIIIPCEDSEQAISIANQASQPYSVGVFTQDITKAFSLSRELKSLNVVVNGSPSTKSFEIGQTANGELNMFNEVTKIKTLTLKNVF
jgi:acyl-CoA reductase-like NAD-dependent aldehyde dehydrogenase